MCNTLETQRRVVVERLADKTDQRDREKLERLLAEAFDAGVMEAQAEEEIVEQRRANHAAFAAEQAHDLGLDAPPVDDAQLDEAMREIEAEREAIMSGCVEPPRGGWLCEIRARGMGDDS